MNGSEFIIQHRAAKRRGANEELPPDVPIDVMIMT
jgi:hypothetical protein